VLHEVQHGNIVRIVSVAETFLEGAVLVEPFFDAFRLRQADTVSLGHTACNDAILHADVGADQGVMRKIFQEFIQVEIKASRCNDDHIAVVAVIEKGVAYRLVDFLPLVRAKGCVDELVASLSFKETMEHSVLHKRSELVRAFVSKAEKAITQNSLEGRQISGEETAGIGQKRHQRVTLDKGVVKIEDGNFFHGLILENYEARPRRVWAQSA